MSSFDPAALDALRAADDGLYAALLIGALQPDTIAATAAAGLDALHPFWSGISAAEIAQARALGLQVNVWTVNGDTFLRQTLAKQPTAIITDEPARLRELVSQGAMSNE